MTIINAHDLTRHDLNQLGNNLAAEVRNDHDDPGVHDEHDSLDAVNRSLRTLGESIDPDDFDPDLEAACRSEHVAA